MLRRIISSIIFFSVNNVFIQNTIFFIQCNASQKLEITVMLNSIMSILYKMMKMISFLSHIFALCLFIKHVGHVSLRKYIKHYFLYAWFGKKL